MTVNANIKPTRILVLTSTFPRWEGDHEPAFVFELSKRLGDRFEVIVLAPHAPGAKLIESFGGIQVHRFRYFLTSHQKLAYDGGILANLKKNRLNYLLIPLFILSEFISLVRLLKTFRIDVIHAHWLIPQGLVAVIARALFSRQTAVICTSHGSDLFGLSGKLLAKIKSRVIKRVDKLTVVSHAMRDYASALSGREDIEVIPMGVDLTERFTPPLAKARTYPHELLFVGRLVEQKGVRHIILAMREVLKTHPQTKLLIAGTGPDMKALQQLVVMEGIKAHVQFLGAVDNAALKEVYRSAAIFVAASEQEGFGLVYVEALGCECAVVAADLPAIRDIVIDGVTGLVCQQKNSADLALKIRFLLDHPHIRESLGESGRAHVLKHFDWRMISLRYQSLINASVLNSQ